MLSLFAVLAVCALAALGMGLQRSTLALFLESRGLTPAEIGLYLAIWGVPRALMNIGGGFLVDRLSRRANLLFSTFLQAASYLWTGLAGGGPGIALARTLTGVGSSWLMVSATTTVIDMAPQARRGVLLGFLRTASWAAITLGAGVAVALWQGWGWTASYALAAALGGLGVALVLAVPDAPPPAPPAAGGPKADLVQHFTRPATAALSFTGIMAKVVEDGLVVVAVPLLILGRGLGGPALAGTAVMTYTLVFAFIQPLGGRVADRWGRRSAITAGAGLGCLATAALALAPSPPLLLAAAAVVGGGWGVLFPAVELLAAESAPPGARGRVLGIWRFFRDLGSTIGPLVTGTAVALLGAPGAVWMAAALTVLVVGAALIQPRR